MNHIQQNLETIRAALPPHVLLVAVTKTRTADEINEAIGAGVTDIGENKVQELLDKYDRVKPVRWHLIGHLQTNKVKYIIDKVWLIHSVDSLHLAREIDKRAAQAGLRVRILLQVNAAGEESKFGAAPDETGTLLREILETCPNLVVKGLMFIAPFEEAEAVRPYFRQVRTLYEKLAQGSHPNLDFEYLSMGMSGDYPVAVEEGANLVRVGSAIFGQRTY